MEVDSTETSTYQDDDQHPSVDIPLKDTSKGIQSPTKNHSKLGPLLRTDSQDDIISSSNPSKRRNTYDINREGSVGSVGSVCKSVGSSSEQYSMIG